MSPQERELLTSFLQQLSQAQAGRKDSEAEAMINAACARQPDAAYLLVQRAMQLDYALQATQAQSARLQTEIEQLRGGPAGFLDGPNTWGRGATATSSQPTAAAPAGQPRAQPASASQRSTPWGSGLLGTVAGTAAGVVAGSFLFQGIQGLMCGRDAGAPAGANAAENPAPSTPETTAAADQYDGAPDESMDFADAGDVDLGDLA